MIAYRQEKIDNTICFFIKNHERIAKKKAYKAFIYKYLALFDFAVLEETGKPALDLEYYATPSGPVPVYYFDNLEVIINNMFFIYDDGNGNHIFSTEFDPNLEYFSDYELNTLYEIVDSYICCDITTEEINEISRKRIKAWSVAWNKRTSNREKMYLEDTFPNIFTKEKDQLSIDKEYIFLTYIMSKIK